MKHVPVPTDSIVGMVYANGSDGYQYITDGQSAYATACMIGMHMKNNFSYILRSVVDKIKYNGVLCVRRISDDIAHTSFFDFSTPVAVSCVK